MQYIAGAYRENEVSIKREMVVKQKPSEKIAPDPQFEGVRTCEMCRVESQSQKDGFATLMTRSIEHSHDQCNIHDLYQQTYAVNKNFNDIAPKVPRRVFTLIACSIELSF